MSEQPKPSVMDKFDTKGIAHAAMMASEIRAMAQVMSNLMTRMHGRPYRAAISPECGIVMILRDRSS
ncbi:hypothetical protein [Aerobium aerolatum]|uniref:Uncharacterized protein n=1 Tax=Aquamicrobium aerolatum DSM 21857 TaxID=1121003 RepID=A0A1I3S901_9HYPH|nr:hypothetical protein [Aquamicrobium aerolatum]SFJ54006.1 hypothetical protein SAMN03080618_03263 [Aquamicrobium aerolatum DSM 21857]